MSELTFISEARVSIEGTHLATVMSIGDAISQQGTPQIEVKFKAPFGSITRWFNLQGYEKDADGEFITDKDGKRIHSDENTAKALRIFANFANDAGIEAGKKFGPSDLLDAEVGIVVTANDQGKYHVKRTMPADQLVVEEESMS